MKLKYSTFLFLFFHLFSSFLFSPTPPFFQQYSSLVVQNGNKRNSFVDLKLGKDRTDFLETNESISLTIIHDYNLNRSYIITKDSCFWNKLVTTRIPFLYFPFFRYIGLVNCPNSQSQMCFFFQGCHPYEVPPAPFDLYTNQTNNHPLHLVFPSLPPFPNTFEFYNFYVGPLPNSTFNIPSNCNFIADIKELKEIIQIPSSIWFELKDIRKTKASKSFTFC